MAERSISYKQATQEKGGEPMTATPAADTKPVEGASDEATAERPAVTAVEKCEPNRGASAPEAPLMAPLDPFWSTKGKSLLEAVRGNTAGDSLE